MTCKAASGQHDLLWCALSQAQYRLYYSTHTFGRRMEQTPKYIADPARGGKTGLAQAGVNHNRNTWEIQQELQVWESFCNDFGFPCGSTICPGQDKLGWSDYLPRCVLQKGTTRQVEETSSRHLTERWQRWHSHTRSFGTPGSITMIWNLSSSLKDTKGPRVKWTGSSQLLHRCCSQCGVIRRAGQASGDDVGLRRFGILLPRQKL
ncbi:hypothetical protein GQ600_9857 [Phytophthora cactorum]|nr:hypothetical protein GQ600_9857 [Phytophthora cactorum]